MARIKVTGYVDVEDLDDDYVDLDNEMGLSNAGYELFMGITDKPTPIGQYMDDLDFELEDD